MQIEEQPSSARYTTEYITSLHGEPVWDAIWSVIKGWDIRREGASGYHGPTGDDVTDIYRAVEEALQINGRG